MIPELQWGRRTYLMGVLNVTPDSFSGDGLAAAGRSEAEVVELAVTQGRAFVDAGAEILDIGAESTRPRRAYGEHPEVDAETEMALAMPVVRAVVAALGDEALVSIDTSKGIVARAAIDGGARMVNDVWAAQRDPSTAEAAATSGAYLVLMHNQEGTDYPDGVFDAVVEWLDRAVADAIVRGVPRLSVDPGIGFGKGTEENLEMLHRLGELKARLGGLPLLVGTSRKRFLGELLGGAGVDDRVEGTAASVALAIAAGVDIVRVHDVAHIDRTRRVADAIMRR